MTDMENLKAQVYDRLALVERLQMEMRELNQRIKELSEMEMNKIENKKESIKLEPKINEPKK